MDFNARYELLSEIDKDAFIGLCARGEVKGQHRSVYFDVRYSVDRRKQRKFNRAGVAKWFKTHPDSLRPDKVVEKQKIFFRDFSKYTTEDYFFEKKQDLLPWLNDCIKNRRDMLWGWTVELDYQKSTLVFFDHVNAQVYFILKKVAVDYFAATGETLKLDLSEVRHKMNYLPFVCARFGDQMKLDIDDEIEMYRTSDRKVVASSSRCKKSSGFWEQVTVYDKKYLDEISNFVDEFSKITDGYRVKIELKEGEGWTELTFEEKMKNLENCLDH